MISWFIMTMTSLFLVTPDNQVGNFREVVIITTKQNVLLQKQQTNFGQDPEGFKDRDLKMTVCTNDSCRDKYAANVNNRDKFTVILIGKDGGLKGKWNRLLDIKELFAIIDAMPMRKSEMEKLRK